MIDIVPNPCFRTTHAWREGKSTDEVYARVLERNVSYRQMSNEQTAYDRMGRGELRLLAVLRPEDVANPVQQLLVTQILVLR